MSGVAGSPVAVTAIADDLLPGPTSLPVLHSKVMRTWGRVTDPSGAKFWVEVTPDANGYLDSIYLCALAQTLKLNWNESPFYADWGLPAHASVLMQVAPDAYVAMTQGRYAARFMSLLVSKRQGTVDPTYDIFCQFEAGATVSVTQCPMALTDTAGNWIPDAYGNPIPIGTRLGRFTPT